MMKISTLNKILGQHFLINQVAISKIVAALDLKPNDVIVEIGSGRGALTLPLLEKCQKIGCRVIAIEKDETLGGTDALIEIFKKMNPGEPVVIDTIPQNFPHSF